jgi:hypothetical protein
MQPTPRSGQYEEQTTNVPCQNIAFKHAHAPITGGVGLVGLVFILTCCSLCLLLARACCSLMPAAPARCSLCVCVYVVLCVLVCVCWYLWTRALKRMGLDGAGWICISCIITNLVEIQDNPLNASPPRPSPTSAPFLPPLCSVSFSSGPRQVLGDLRLLPPPRAQQ